MAILPGRPAKSALASIRRAAERLNPCLNFEVDLVAVTRTGVASTYEDWMASTTTRTNTEVERATGIVELTRAAGGAVLTSQVDTSSQLSFEDSSNGVLAHALDWFIEPAVVNGAPVQLEQLKLWLSQRRNPGLAAFNASNAYFEITVGIYDDRWQFVPLGHPVRLPAREVALDGGWKTLDFRTTYLRRFVFEPGMLYAPTGPGKTSGGAGRAATTLQVPRGLSIQVKPVGRDFASAGIAASTNASLGYVTSDFWRVDPQGLSSTPAWHFGPYDPELGRYDGTVGTPTEHIITGAVPGYGARSVTVNGATVWLGAARRMFTAGRGQRQATSWPAICQELRLSQYAASGSVRTIIDLGATSTAPVQVRIDDWQPAGTSIAYALETAPDPAGPWTARGAVTDGEELTGVKLARAYAVTATLTPGPATGTPYTSPGVQAIALAERVRYATARQLAELEADVTVDPVTGQSTIGELTLALLRAGPRDARDLATRIASGVSPSRLEAHVFAVNTRDPNAATRRLFLNAYRLDDREPGLERETFKFVSGLDRLKVRIPPTAETYVFPVVAGTVATAASVATSDASVVGVGYRYVDITVAGTPFVASALIGYRCVLWPNDPNRRREDVILSNTTSSFRIVVESAANAPAAGAEFTLSSGDLPVTEKLYGVQDVAAICADMLQLQARIPRRLQGALPVLVPDAERPYVAGRLTTGRGDNDKGAEALTQLQHLGLYAGGVWVWEKGRIAFADLYGPKSSVVDWDERHLVSLTPAIGASRRRPLVEARYAYDYAANRFAGVIEGRDEDAVKGWGIATISAEKVSDDLCKWLPGRTAAEWFTRRQLEKHATGIRLWRAETVFEYPWLEIGMAVTIRTDQYTDRRFAFQGETDVGTPIAGRVAAVGVIVGKDLRGSKFVVWIPGQDAIQSAAIVAGAGVLGGPLDAIGVPAITPTAVTQGTPPNNTVVLKLAYTPPATPYFAGMEYRVRSKRLGLGDDTFTAASVVVGGATGDDTVPAAYGREYELVPITRSSGGRRLEGAAFRVPVGENPAADPTFAEPVAEAGRIVYRWTWDDDTPVMYVHSVQAPNASAPAVQNVAALAPQPVAVIYRMSGQTELALPVDATNDTRTTTFIPVDANNRPGPIFNRRTQRNAAAAAPLPPAAVSLHAKTATSATIRVTMQNPLGSPAPDTLRLVRDGAVVASTAPGAAGAQVDIVDTGRTPSTTYQYQAELVAAGVASSRVPSTPLSVTTDPGTIDAPTLTSAVRTGGAQVDLAWTPGANTPPGTQFEIQQATSSGGVYAVVGLTTSPSWSGLVSGGLKYFRIVADAPYWTASAPSNVLSA